MKRYISILFIAAVCGCSSVHRDIQVTGGFTSQHVGSATASFKKSEAKQILGMLQGFRDPRYYMPLDDCDGVFGMQSDAFQLSLADGTHLTIVISRDGTEWEEHWGDKVGHGPVSPKLKEYINTIRIKRHEEAQQNIRQVSSESAPSASPDEPSM